MAAVTICSDFGAKNIKSVTVSIVSPPICHEVMGADAIMLSSVQFISVYYSSVAQSRLTLCDPMDCSMQGLPVYQQLPEVIQTHVL